MNEKQVTEQLFNMLSSNLDTIEREKEMAKLLNDYCCHLVSQTIERLDDEMVGQMTSNGYKIDRKDERTVHFLFGSVTYIRRRYIDLANKLGFYPVDYHLGMFKHKKYSPLVMARVAELATKMPYRTCEEAISILTPLKISFNTIRNLVLKTDKLISNYKEYHEQLEDEKTEQEELLSNKQKRKVPILYLEGDGLDLFMQDRNFPRKTLHRYLVHEGTQPITRSRNKCVNMYQSADFNRKTAYQDMFKYLRTNYDLTDTIIITNSDNGSGYTYNVFYELTLGCKNHEHFVDKYHVNEKLIQRMSFCKEMIPRAKRMINRWDESERNAIIKEMLLIADNIKDDEQRQKALEDCYRLRGYLSRNWKFIKPIAERELGVNMNGIGVSESTHRPFSYRMKRQGRTWKKKGGNAIAHIISEKKNERFDDVFDFEWQLTLEKKELNEKAYERNIRVIVRTLLRLESEEAHEGVRKGRVPKEILNKLPDTGVVNYGCWNM